MVARLRADGCSADNCIRMVSVCCRIALSPRRRCNVLAAILTGMLIGGTEIDTAHADEPTEFSVDQLRLEVRDRLVQEGNQAVRALRFERAEDIWSLAYALVPDSVMLLNLAEACRNERKQQEVYILLQRFLQEDPGTRRKAEIEEQIQRSLVVLGTSPSPRALKVAQEHVQLGVTAYVKQDYSLASREFSLAYALSPTPELLYNLANTRRKMEAVAEAFLLYEQYLKSAGSTAQRNNAELYRSQLFTTIQQNQPPPKPVSVPPTIPLPPAPVIPPAAPPTIPKPVALPQMQLRLTPYFEVTLGPAIGSRFLRASSGGTGPCQVLTDATHGAYTPGLCPEVTLPGTAGLQSALSIFPLASSGRRWAQGIGLDGGLEWWPVHHLCGNAGADGSCTGGELNASRLHILAGVRWDIYPWNRRGSATFGLFVHYGRDRQEISATDDLMQTMNLSTITYQYVDAGINISVPLINRENFGLRTGLRAGYLAPLSYGELADPSAAAPERPRFGAIQGGHGVRLHSTLLEIQPWQGLVLQLTCTYQFMSVRMDDTPTDATFPAFLVSRLDDHRLGAGMNIGYRY